MLQHVITGCNPNDKMDHEAKYTHHHGNILHKVRHDHPLASHLHLVRWANGIFIGADVFNPLNPESFFRLTSQKKCTVLVPTVIYYR
jgi:hypothetical protein